ncbi:MAG: SoxR reducing system RseC family protein [Candidatus Margulisbacteria bacterium]|nr:SoxR reducing system RseC family protein [Candidatus Margulisiibacteriota bacterium]
MLDRGIVCRIEGEKAFIEIAASEKCRGCSACQLLASGQKGVEAENLVGAKIGDLVEVDIPVKGKMLAPIIAFGLPVFFLFLGIILGSFISQRYAIIWGLIFFAVSIRLVRLLDDLLAARPAFKNRITRRLTSAE